MIIAGLAAAAALTCGAASRPGVAERGTDGAWRGRAVEACRAVAAAAAGPGAPIAFHGYDDPAMLRAASNDQVAFLTPDELATPALAAAMRIGPPVATGRQLLVVRAGSPLRGSGALAGQLVCFIIGTRAEDALNAWAARSRVAIERLAFQEPDEMADAFNVGKCAAMAVDAADAPDGATTLGLPLAETQVIAATPRRLGAEWATLVDEAVSRVRGDKEPVYKQAEPTVARVP